MTSNDTTTDGWRGLPGPGWSELDLLAAIDHVASTGALGDQVLVGFDARAGSWEVARLIVNLLHARQISCRIATSPAPTPAVGRLVNSDPQLTAGIIVTASHNPPAYIGVKLRDSDGLGALWSSAPDDFAFNVDAIASPPRAQTHSIDVAQHYATTIGWDLAVIAAQFSGCLMIDAAHGAVGSLAKNLPNLRWARAQPLPFFAGTTPDPALRPDADHVALAALSTSDDPARTVIAMVDGDGDRLVLYTKASGYIGSADQVAILLANGLPVQHLVCSIVAPRMVIATAEQFVPNLCVTETDVGFKHLVSAWRTSPDTPTLGIEPNGAFAWAPRPGTYFERDSLASLTTMLTHFPSIEALDAAVTSLRQRHPHPQQILTTAMPLGPLLTALTGTLAGWKCDEGRPGLTIFSNSAGDHIAARASGTEAATRLYVEAPAETVHQLQQAISSKEERN